VQCMVGWFGVVWVVDSWDIMKSISNLYFLLSCWVDVSYQCEIAWQLCAFASVGWNMVEFCPHFWQAILSGNQHVSSLGPVIVFATN